MQCLHTLKQNINAMFNTLKQNINTVFTLTKTKYQCSVYTH